MSVHELLNDRPILQELSATQLPVAQAQAIRDSTLPNPAKVLHRKNARSGTRRSKLKPRQVRKQKIMRKHKKRIYTDEQKKKYIADWKVSGLPGDTFAKKNKLTRSAFWRWVYDPRLGNNKTAKKKTSKKKSKLTIEQLKPTMFRALDVMSREQVGFVPADPKTRQPISGAQIARIYLQQAREHKAADVKNPIFMLAMLALHALEGTM